MSKKTLGVSKIPTTNLNLHVPLLTASYSSTNTALHTIKSTLPFTPSNCKLQVNLNSYHITMFTFYIHKNKTIAGKIKVFQLNIQNPYNSFSQTSDSTYWIIYTMFFVTECETKVNHLILRTVVRVIANQYYENWKINRIKTWLGTDSLLAAPQWQLDHWPSS